MTKSHDILILSNMGPSLNSPASGLFIENQYQALSSFNEFNIDFFYLSQDKRGFLLSKLKYPIFLLGFIKKFFLTRRYVDLIHVQFFYPNILFAILYKFFKNKNVKILVTFHGSDIYHYMPPSKLYSWATNFIDESIFVSENLQSKFYKKLKPSTVLSAGILDCFSYNASSKKYDLIFIGHLDQNKGIDRLAKVLSSIRKHVSIAIVGQGDTSNLSSLFELQQHNVQYFGTLSPEQLAKIINQSRFLINLSRNESFGLVMTEAMSCGVPVIATKTDGSLLQVFHKSNGFLLDNDDDFIELNGSKCISDWLSISAIEYKSLCSQSLKSSAPYRLSDVAKRLRVIYNELLLK